MATNNVGITILEVAKRIREINEGKNKKAYPIPDSDTIYRKHMADLVKNQDELMHYLRILVEAHYLFDIHIVEPDDTLMIDGVYGYITADVVILRNLKEMAAQELEAAYEQQYYRRKQAGTVLRELLPQARNFNNTQLGRALNVSLMIEQFEHIMLSAMNEYSDGWRRRKLEELLPELKGQSLPVSESEEEPGGGDAFVGSGGSAPPVEGDMPVGGDPQAPSGAEGVLGPDFAAGEESSFSSAATESSQAGSMRAADSSELNKIQEMDRSGRWGDAVDRFGVQFLLRIHFRKYEFDKVRWLIRSNKIAREEDLRYVRDTIRTMEGRFDQDPHLLRFQKEMGDVKRMAQMRLNQIFQMKKNLGRD